MVQADRFSGPVYQTTCGNAEGIRTALLCLVFYFCFLYCHFSVVLLLYLSSFYLFKKYCTVEQ